MFKSVWGDGPESVGGTLGSSFIICIKSPKQFLILGIYPKAIISQEYDDFGNKVCPSIVYNIKTSRNSINIHQ